MSEFLYKIPYNLGFKHFGQSVLLRTTPLFSSQPDRMSKGMYAAAKCQLSALLSLIELQLSPVSPAFLFVAIGWCSWLHEAPPRILHSRILQRYTTPHLTIIQIRASEPSRRNSFDNCRCSSAYAHGSTSVTSLLDLVYGKCPQSASFDRADDSDGERPRTPREQWRIKP
jgi:hypothetical protein